MRREIRISLRRGDQSGHEQSGAFAEAWDRFVASIPAHALVNQRDTRRPARLRVQNKEPKRHKVASPMEVDSDSASSQSCASSSSSDLIGTNHCHHHRRRRHHHHRRDAATSSSPAGPQFQQASKWDQILEDKAKMIEMHAF